MRLRACAIRVRVERLAQLRVMNAGHERDRLERTRARLERLQARQAHRQQRSTPLCMSVTLALGWRGPLRNTACSAPQARALIGVTTSRWAGLWLIQDGSVATVSFLRLFGVSSH